MTPTSFAPNPFHRSLFQFLRDLERNNDRAWFQANKERYENDLKDPALRFISDYGPHLKRISPHFLAIPKAVGGSLFRIYRDVRFSSDKSPYKTHLGIQFRHEKARDAHAPGYYLHIQPKGCFVGAGMWHPDGPSLGMIRQRIQEDPTGWRRATSGKDFEAGWLLEGGSLKRPPRGVEVDHPLVEDLKRKDFIGVTRITQKQVLASDFPRFFDTLCRQGTPLVKFLCGAVDVAF